MPEISLAKIDSDASLRFAGLYNVEGTATTSFRAREPISLKCSFDVARPIAGLQFSFAVLDFKQERLFYSTASMADPPLSVESAGKHTLAAEIPARLLLPGRYFINLALHTPKTKLYDSRPRVLSFQVHAGMGDNYDGFSGEDLGKIYADVKWRV